MVLGIPTRSDAVKLSLDYAEALRIDEINRKIGALGRYDGVFKEVITKAESNALAVYTSHLLRITEFMQLMQDNAEWLWLYGVTSNDICHGNGHPYSPLPAWVEVMEVKTVEQTIDSPTAKTYRYLYDAKKLVEWLISEGIQRISDAFMSDGNDRAKILAMREALRNINRSSAMELAKFKYRTSAMHAYDIENNKKHQVGILVEANERIVKTSDFALRFDETYFDTKSNDLMQLSIPAFGILDEEQRFTFAGLLYRQMLRDAILQVVATKGCVVINGITYTPKLHNGTYMYDVNGESCTQIANILGKLINQRRGPLLRPESWVNGEVLMIEAYRARQTSEAAEALTTRYEFGDQAHNQLAQLLKGWKPAFF